MGMEPWRQQLLAWQVGGSGRRLDCCFAVGHRLQKNEQLMFVLLLLLYTAPYYHHLAGVAIVRCARSQHVKVGVAMQQAEQNARAASGSHAAPLLHSVSCWGVVRMLMQTPQQVSCLSTAAVVDATCTACVAPQQVVDACLKVSQVDFKGVNVKLLKLTGRYTEYTVDTPQPQPPTPAVLCSACTSC